MHKLPTVSVIVPAYNCGRYVASAVTSALQQDYPPAEVIVVNDGSTDETEARLSDFGGVITVVHQSNRGPAAARNCGVRYASGELVSFLDADDVWLPGKLSKQVEKLHRGEFGLVHCGLRYVDEHGIRLFDEVSGEEGWVALAILRYRGRPVLQGLGSTALLRRHDYLEVGGMDESLRVAEDWDFGYRFASRYRVGFVAEPLVLYRQHAASSHKSKVCLQEESLRRVFARAFAESGPELEPIKREAYGNLYMGLAISDYCNARYGRSAINLARSLWNRPSLMRRPLRFARRYLSGHTAGVKHA